MLELNGALIFVLQLLLKRIRHNILLQTAYFIFAFCKILLADLICLEKSILAGFIIALSALSEKDFALEFCKTGILLIAIAIILGI